MRCEYCGKMLLDGEITHGFRYGEVDVFHEAFIPAKDSGWTVICGPCGELVFKMVYSKLASMTRKQINPTIYKTFMQTR